MILFIGNHEGLPPSSFNGIVIARGGVRSNLDAIWNKRLDYLLFLSCVSSLTPRGLASRVMRQSLAIFECQIHSFRVFVCACGQAFQKQSRRTIKAMCYY